MISARAFGRYTPLLAVLAVQALLVLSAPTPHSSSVATGSNGGSSGSLNGSEGGGSNGGGSGSGGGSGVGSTGGSGGGGATVPSGAGGTGSGPSGSGSTAANGTSGAGGTSGVATSGAGCVPVKTLVTYQPPCAPAWNGGNNGGSTMTGVTSTQVRYVYYAVMANAEVNAILNRENLAATPEQYCEAIQAFNTEINKRWQFYGRKAVSLDGPGSNAGSKNQSSCNFPYFQSQCTSSPPDQVCYRAEADAIAAMKPAFVISTVADTSFVYRLAQDHIVVITGGGTTGTVPEQYLTELAPYLYTPGSNGTQQANAFAQFWCSGLADRPVQFGGSDVEHPSGNPLSTPPDRKLIISYAENNGDATDLLNAQYLESLITGKMCGHPGDVVLSSYSSDITTAQQQSDTFIATAKANHVTSATCFCDPIAPVFATNAEEEQDYHPEQILLGSGLLDYDVLGQLYNQDEWRDAFGISNLGDAQPFAQSDAVKAWQDAGRTGEPDKTENLNLYFFEVMADMIQEAGPDLNTSTIHTGLLNMPLLGDNTFEGGLKFTPQYPWSGLHDVREVYFCPTTTSAINGQPGAYIPLANGQRYTIGDVPSTTSGFFPKGQCAP